MENSIFVLITIVGISISIVDVYLKKTGLPVIIFYLIIGLLVGVSGLNILNSHGLDEIYFLSIEIMVALIVFEGAFAINIESLKRVSSVVRKLISIGFLVTFFASSFVVYLSGLLDLQTSFIVGSLVTVSGPTVISPLVKRASLNEKVKAVLIGESILIDPIGAIFAIFVLDIVLSGIHADPIYWIFSRVIIGILFGLIASLIMWLCLRISKKFEKDEILLLLVGSAVATFSFSEIIADGSGLLSVVTLGVMLSGMDIPSKKEVQKTQDIFVRIAIAGVFILASAVVDLNVVIALWPKGFIVIGVIVLLIRPLDVLISSYQSSLSIKEKAYISLVSPRGVVAAALAAFAGEKISSDDGAIVVALVFLIIVITVVSQFSYAGLLSRLLGVESMKALISGNGEISKRIADDLSSNGYQVLVILSNEEDGYFDNSDEKIKIYKGSAADEKFIHSLNLREVNIVAGVSDSDENNLLFIQIVKTIKPDVKSYALVNTLDSITAFESLGIKAIKKADAAASSLLELMGNPSIHNVIGGEGEPRLVLEVEVARGIKGKKVKSLSLPNGVLVILIQRKDEEVVPRGETVLQNGDKLLLFGRSTNVNLARDMLLQFN